MRADCPVSKGFVSEAVRGGSSFWESLVLSVRLGKTSFFGGGRPVELVSGRIRFSGTSFRAMSRFGELVSERSRACGPVFFGGGLFSGSPYRGLRRGKARVASRFGVAGRSGTIAFGPHRTADFRTAPPRLRQCAEIRDPPPFRAACGGCRSDGEGGTAEFGLGGCTDLEI